MGVIAVAVYPEVQRRESEDRLRSSDRAARPEAPAAKSMQESAGTGFGRSEHSPVRVVSFDPESVPAEKVLLKYEWRSTLCQQGVVQCGTPRPPRNRLWDHSGFAPFPPGRS
jgi:hypothetical protein